MDLRVDGTQGRLGRDLLRLVAGAALYGAVLGSWSGARLAVYAAVKLPLVLLSTCALTLLVNALVAALLGERAVAARAARLTVAAMAVTALLLASLAPVSAFFHLALPRPSPEARATHNGLYLMHTGFVALCGLAGALRLRAALGRACARPGSARRLFVAWVVTLALVGGEVAWALRPFVGSVFEPVAFVRADALDGNVYELIWTDVLPFLAAGEPPPAASRSRPSPRPRPRPSADQESAHAYSE